MTTINKIIIRCIAILMIGGIVLIGGYSLYKSITEIDKPVPMVSETDSIGRPFEINGYQYYLRNNALYDEKGNMVVNLSADNYSTSKTTKDSLLLKDVLNEAFGGEKEEFVDYGIFGCSKEEAQRLYIQSVINSITSGQKVEVSRWVTSGDWSHDDDE